MSVRLTTSEHVTALYDSTTGKCLGEIFEDEDEAGAFLDFVRDDGRDIRHPAVYTELRNTWNDKVRDEWEAAHADGPTIHWTEVEWHAIGCDVTDEAHSNGVCPDEEAARDAALPEVPF